MTTRRARLQVKPNISGPKGPAAGMPNLGIISDVPDASNQTVGCPKPGIVDALPVISNVDKIQEKHSSDNNEVLINSADGLVKEPTALDVHGKVPDVAEESHSQVTNVVLPSRARFRRFGKVNLSAIKDATPFGDHRPDVLSDSRLLQDNTVTVSESTKSDSLQNEAVEDTTEDQTQTSEKAIDHDHCLAIDKTGETYLEKSLEMHMETNTAIPIETYIERSIEASIEKSVETNIERSVETDVHKHLEPNREINNKEKMVPDIPCHAIRRSRFAKAKPNIVDTRRKQKESMKENVPKLSITEEDKQTTPIPPKITITPAEPDSVFTKCANITCPPDPAEYMTQIRSSSLHAPKSPIRPGVTPQLISPVKTVVDGHDKWYKMPTHSQTEPIIVKKARKHKIDVPTDQPPDKSIMKMRDLIHWNPSNNPMKLTDKLSTKLISGNAKKENVDKKIKAAQQQNNGLGTIDMEDDNALPPAQVTIGPNGNIVINETSLVVKVPDIEKGATQEHDIIDETDLVTTYSSFRRTNRSSRWTKRETLKFYKALAMIGTDFFLINKLFPKRNRFEIKKKFKREEKVNSVLMEKALKERLKFDPDVFKTKDDELSSSSDENNKIAKQRKKKVEEKVDNCKDENNKNKSKRTKSRKRLYNYYEMDLPDSEPEDSSVIGDDPTCESTNVSRKDGEIVGILMDKSEGHLATGDQELSDIYIATPVRKSGQARGKALPGSRSRAKEMINNKQKTAGVNITEGSNDVILHADKRPSKHAPNQIEHQSNTPDCYMQPQTSQGSIETLSNQLQYQVPTYVNVPSMVTDLSDSLHGTAVQNQQVQYSFMGNNYGMITPISLPIVNSHAASLLGLPANQGDGDQYVLVTVLSENGQETVIHIYRLHGGIQPTVVVENTDMTIGHSDCAQMGNIDNVQIEGTENTVDIDKIMNENDDQIHVENIGNTHMEAMDISHTENVQNIQIVNAHTLNMGTVLTESVDTLHLDYIQTQTESVDKSHKNTTQSESVDMDNTQTESVHTENVDMDNTPTETERMHTSHIDNICYTAIECIDNTIIENRECTILEESNPSLKRISDVNCTTDEPIEHASNT